MFLVVKVSNTNVLTLWEQKHDRPLLFFTSEDADSAACSDILQTNTHQRRGVGAIVGRGGMKLDIFRALSHVVGSRVVG